MAAMGWTTRIIGVLLGSTIAMTSLAAAASEGEKPRDIVYTKTPPAPAGQTKAEAERKSLGCLTCHVRTDEPSMHANPGVVLGCTDCHGGEATVSLPRGSAPGDFTYRATLDRAHVQPRYPKTWHYPSSANPAGSYTLLNKESPEFVRFVNPSDYRVVDEACGACHQPIVNAAKTSIMATGAMFWGGAAYNNGILPFKNYILGEAYTREGVAASIKAPVKPDARMAKRGILPQLFPLPAWEVTPPGDIFRVFERGGRNILNLFPEIGLPNAVGQLQRLEEPGRPDIRQSNRGPGPGCASPYRSSTFTRRG